MCSIEGEAWQRVLKDQRETLVADIDWTCIIPECKDSILNDDEYLEISVNNAIQLVF